MQNELCIVADAIKALREARGLTQEQLAEKADISVSHLAKIDTCQGHGHENLYPAVGSYGYSHKRTLHAHGYSEKRYDAEGKDLVSGTGL